MNLKIINTKTGKITGKAQSKNEKTSKDSLVIDLKTQEFDAVRKVIMPKTPDRSATLPYKFARLEAKVTAQAAEIAALKTGFAKLKSSLRIK